VKVSHPSDRFEREAVANADHVMASPAPAVAPAGVQRMAAESVVQREEAPEEEETAQTFVQREEEQAEEETA
jgi:hypothetical protein